MKKQKLPQWYQVVFLFILTLWLGINIIYQFGGEGIKFRHGGEISFDRKFDFQLFSVDEKHALLMSGKYISLVKYKKGLFPFCLICGKYDSDGSIINGVAYFKNDWLYSSYPGASPFFDAFHISTGKTLKSNEEPNFDGPDPKIYQQNNLLRDPSYQLTNQVIIEKFPILSTLKESCLVFNAAFMILITLLIPIGIFYYLKNN